MADPTADPASTFRQRRLAALVEGVFGGVKALAGRELHLGTGPYVRQLIDGERPITEKTIAKIERAQNGRFAGWFDPEVEPSREEMRLLADLRVLLPEEQLEIIEQVSRAADRTRRIRELPSPATVRKKIHEMSAGMGAAASTSAQPRIAGDGNPDQGHLLLSPEFPTAGDPWTTGPTDREQAFYDRLPATRAKKGA